MAIYKSGTGGLNTLRYVHTDHLGSITELTNETGGLVESLSYDPWGKRRNADWSDAAGQLYASHTKRSFTGHEYLEDAGLIHMNGRVYEPDTGRMLSPDPFINQPANTQSYNRYSYVLNNPLSYTDPSGYEIEEITINGTRIHIRPLDLKTGLRAAFLFSNSSSSYPVVSSSFFVLAPETVAIQEKITPTGSRISRWQTTFLMKMGSKLAVYGNGKDGELKDSKALEYTNKIRNIVFGETRSYTGVSIDEVRQKIAHILINRIMEGMPVGKVPHTANDYFARSLNPEEERVISDIHQIVNQVLIERSFGVDPTYGALHFNFRDPDYLSLFNKNLTSSLWGLPVTDIIGPLNNSYPTTELGPDNNFFVIYRE